MSERASAAAVEAQPEQHPQPQPQLRVVRSEPDLDVLADTGVRAEGKTAKKRRRASHVRAASTSALQQLWASLHRSHNNNNNNHNTSKPLPGNPAAGGARSRLAWRVRRRGGGSFGSKRALHKPANAGHDHQHQHHRQHQHDDEQGAQQQPDVAPAAAPAAAPASPAAVERPWLRALDVRLGDAVLGEFRLGQDLGRGQYGRVKVALHQPSGELVAVKVFPRLVRECLDHACADIKAARAVHDHPNVVTVRRVIQTPSKLFVVQDLASLGDLANLVHNHFAAGLPPALARAVFAQVARAVAHVHSRGLVHRDIKAENCLLRPWTPDDAAANPDGRAHGLHVLLSDFGLACAQDNALELNTFVRGTLNYMPPELLTRTVRAAAKVDVWSCGVLLHVLLTGSLVFCAESPAEALDLGLGLAVDGALSSRLLVHPAHPAHSLLCGMLCVDPASRLDMPAVLSHPWLCARP